MKFIQELFLISEMFFENLIAPPGAGAACLDFRYKKYSTGQNLALKVPSGQIGSK